MERTNKKGTRLFMLGASLLLSTAMFAAETTKLYQEPAPDNTKVNTRDRDKSAVTADQQKANLADRQTTRKIRQAIFKDKTLSTYGHNVKVITRDGVVTLRGPVRTEEEKSNVEAKASAVAGKDNVKSELEIAPKKS